MKIIQGFVTIPSLADNAVGVIAEFGELSKHARTYTKDIRHLSNTAAYPDIEIVTAKAINENNEDITIADQLSDYLLQVSDWIYKEHTRGDIPLPRAKALLQDSIASTFNFCSNVNIGEILNTSNPSKRFIDYVRFDCAYDGDIYRVTLWYSDERFKVQYSYYDIVVIPPVDNLDRLTVDSPTAAVAIQSTSTSTVVNKIGYYTRLNVPTDVIGYNVTHHDPSKKVNPPLLKTNWTVLLYGSMAQDTESIKAAIRDYLGDNSNYPDWHIIFPELYSTNEFIIVPFWDSIATKEFGYDNGLYRTLVSSSKLADTTKRVVPNTYKIGKQSEQYLANNVMMGSAFYRTITFMSLGSPSNSNKVHRLTDLFPDYMAVSTDSPDFARMALDTQAFALKFNECLNKARLYTPNEKFPEGFTRGVKGTRIYIGFDILGFTFFVLTRQGYLKDIDS